MNAKAVITFFPMKSVAQSYSATRRKWGETGRRKHVEESTIEGRGKALLRTLNRIEKEEYTEGHI